jgi:glycerol uptake facilitator-like aquaporin
VLAQTLGAFIGALFTYANYFHAIDQYEGDGVRTVPGTAQLFATYPLEYMPAAACFFSEVNIAELVYPKCRDMNEDHRFWERFSWSS